MIKYVVTCGLLPRDGVQCILSVFFRPLWCIGSSRVPVLGRWYPGRRGRWSCNHKWVKEHLNSQSSDAETQSNGVVSLSLSALMGPVTGDGFAQFAI